MISDQNSMAHPTTSPQANMLTKEAVSELERQQYRVIGSHSAVKICGWTRNMINGEGGCYKLKFYGIMSNQCLQMTTSISCANRCTFCWRGYKAPVSKEWRWSVDNPQNILEGSLAAHHHLLVGYGGSYKANKSAFEKSKTVRHVALSLTGEPITYPGINDLISQFHSRGISTFMVTNAQYPLQIHNLLPVTQLYLSIDAPTKSLLKKVDVPLFSDYYERMLRSLDEIKGKPQRTAIRLTIIKGINDQFPEKYAALILRGQPDFIEVKAYMFVGSSQQRLSRSNMPLHEEIVQWSHSLHQHLPGYQIVSEHVPSRVVLLAKDKFKKADGWHTWIDFDAFHRLSQRYEQTGSIFTTDDYLARTPLTGLSGITTAQNSERNKARFNRRWWRSEKRSEKKLPLSQSTNIFVDEHTDELSFYDKTPDDA